MLVIMEIIILTPLFIVEYCLISQCLNLYHPWGHLSPHRILQHLRYVVTTLLMV